MVSASREFVALAFDALPRSRRPSERVEAKGDKSLTGYLLYVTNPFIAILQQAPLTTLVINYKDLTCARCVVSSFDHLHPF